MKLKLISLLLALVLLLASCTGTENTAPVETPAETPAETPEDHHKNYAVNGAEISSYIIVADSDNGNQRAIQSVLLVTVPQKRVE